MRSTGLVRIAAIVACVSCFTPFASRLRADDTSMTGMMMRESGMRGMLMLDSASGPIPLVELTKNDPSPPPPYSNIGEVSIPVSTDRQVQGYFDQGLRFYYGFNNRESYRAFKYAAQRSLDLRQPCALCFWGMALPLGVDINMSDQLEPDRKAADDALAAARGYTTDDKTLRLIAALAARFVRCHAGETQKDCQDRRNAGYHAGMDDLVHRYSNDPNVIVLFVDSVLNLTAWQLPSPENFKEARSRLEVAMPANPRHDGLRHWYIHLMELSAEPQAAERAADELAPLAPAAGHVVHMPSHIYYRVGKMHKAVDTNIAAVAADQKYFATENLSHPDGDRYRYGYYPHDLHFLIAASVLSGRSADLNNALTLLYTAPPPNADGYRKDKYREVFYLGHANFATPSALRSLPKPEAGEARAAVAYAYTQAMADVWEGRSSDVTMKALDTAVFAYPNIEGDPYTACVNSSRDFGDTGLCMVAFEYYLAHGRADGAKRLWDSALNWTRRTHLPQTRMPYDEPPDWFYPTAQTTAGLLIQKAIAQDPRLPQSQEALKEAKDLLLKSLELHSSQSGIYPGNGWAYFGLWQVAKYLQGDHPIKAEEVFRAHWRDPVTADVPSLKRM